MKILAGRLFFSYNPDNECAIALLHAHHKYVFNKLFHYNVPLLLVAFISSFLESAVIPLSFSLPSVTTSSTG